ncbi:MAG TPA: dihydroorotate dehydrogenase [Candidatus Nanoarchaeia archaeon]|nr:dihydroorotate dehydrogenase [Candidatus Nanoarchaeia archaeon]
MLQTKLCNITLSNPTILASGILGMGAPILKRVVKEGGAGAVTMKSIGMVERKGHQNPKILVWEHGMINCVGLPGPGYKNMEEEWQELRKRDFPLIASIYAPTIEKFSEISSFIAEKKPEMIEVNMSCPNTSKNDVLFCTDPSMTGKVVETVKNAVGKIPVSAKLSPTENIASVAKAAEEAGADAITAINSAGPGMLIDIDAKKPVLSFKTGGLSGPAIKPIAVRCVYQVYETVDIPVIGTGGITYGKDAIEMLMAGATALGIGTAVHYRGMDVFKKVCSEMEAWMKERGYSGIKQLIGEGHKQSQ